MKTLAPSLTLVLALTIPVPALAQRPPTSEAAAKEFKRLDTSANGYLSGTELDGGATRSYDANKDNRVMWEEFVAGYTGQKPSPPKPPARPAEKPAATGGFAVGDKVELEASNHWVPCVVAENAAASLMRVRCEAYPKLSRDAGVYMVDRDNPAAVRKAGTAPGRPVSPPATKAAPPAKTATKTGLRLGEYACYGSGGRIMAGLGFKVLAGNRYTDLEGGNAGSYSTTGDTVSFRGGHLDAKSGRDLRNQNFRIGAQATCEPF